MSAYLSDSIFFATEAPGAGFLFDRKVDPGENVNLVAREPAEAARMQALLEEHRSRAAPEVVETDVRIDADVADRLRAMGYLR